MRALLAISLLFWQPVPKHLTEAIALADAIKPDQTEYRHRPSVMKWPSEGGPECRTDCSGFVDLLLQHSYSWADKDWLEEQTGKLRPLASDLYDAVLAHHGFDPVAKISDVQPGDFIVMKYPEDNDNTGHTMLVEHSPRSHSASAPVHDTDRQWEVDVIDETSSPHGETDSRYKGTGVKNGGLGRGTFRLYTHSDGSFSGYAWSLSPKTKFYGPEARQLTIARLLAAR